MKTSHFFYILLAFILSSCGKQNENNRFAEDEFDSNGYYNGNQSQTRDNLIQVGNHQNRSNIQATKYYSIMSPDFGIPYGVMPIPVSWKKSSNTKENLLLEGPKGIKIYSARFNHFGIDKPVKSIEKIINEVLKPYVQSQGLRLVKKYPLPQLVEFDTRLDSYLFKATPYQKQFQCIVTEWKDQQGNLSLVIIRHYITQYQIGGKGWGYTFNAMEAPKDSYEEAKSAYINALVNFQINPQWIQKNNQYWSQVAQNSTAGHRQRMGAIKAFGDANTEAFNKRNAAFDAQNNSWKARQESSYKSQSKYIDGIWDRTTITNSDTGQSYKVEAGSNYYWMNNNGEYIKSDNPNYNPNTDPNYNNQNWSKTKIKN